MVKHLEPVPLPAGECRMWDEIEKAIISLLEHCGVRHEAGAPLGPNEFIAEVVPIPYADFQRGAVPGWWLRAVLLHVHDTWGACRQVSEHVLALRAYLQRRMRAVNSDWFDDYLAVTVSDELRLHVFCFLVCSETIRDKMRSAYWVDDGHFLVPDLDKRSCRSPLPVKLLASELVRRGCAGESEALWVSRQLARLDAHCRHTEAAIEEFVSFPDGAAWNLGKRFTNLQAAFTELARVLLDADVAVDIYSHCDFGPAADE